MGADLTQLPLRAGKSVYHVVVESPRGSTVKLKFEPRLGAFTLARPLSRGFSYPFDWGFLPSTCGADGDPLDAMVRWDQPTYPGVVLPCRAIGVLKVDERAGRRGGRARRERNDRLLCVPVGSWRDTHLVDVDGLAPRERAELEHFFLQVVGLSEKDVRILGWGGAREAEALLEAAAVRS